MAFSFTVFMSKVGLDNTTFKRFKSQSCLDPLIAALPHGPGLTMPTALQKAAAQKALYHIPHTKQKTYKSALAYLETQLGLKLGGIPTDPKMSFDGLFVQKSIYVGTDGQTYQLDPNDSSTLGPRGFLHRHTLSWKCSNGDPTGLAQVRTREYVKFLTDTQAPPFNNIQDPDREFYAPGPPHTAACLGTLGGNSNTDDHSTKNPALILCHPRVPGQLQAQQWYQYSNDGGVSWHNIEGAAFLITKSVARAGNDWTFTFIKENWVPHNNRQFRFEVEYLVGPSPAVMPMDDKKVPAGSATAAKLSDWARRHVVRG